MNVFEPADRLQFYDDPILDEKVEAVFADLVIFVEKRDCFLPDELNAAEREFHSKRLLIDRFKKTRAELPVDANRSRDNAFGRFPIP